MPTLYRRIRALELFLYRQRLMLLLTVDQHLTFILSSTFKLAQRLATMGGRMA